MAEDKLKADTELSPDDIIMVLNWVPQYKCAAGGESLCLHACVHVHACHHC
jgi:hypothetical protein